jgi:hypothetical protein
MRGTLTAIGMAIMAGSLIAQTALASAPTDPKKLVLHTGDVHGKFKVTKSYEKKSKANKPLYQHGLVRAFQEEFVAKNLTQPWLVVGSDVASFGATSGAKWTMGYLPKKVGHGISAGVKVKPASAPHFGQQSLAFSLSYRSGRTRYAGLVIAIRHGRYDGLVLTLGPKSKFKAKSTYPLASKQAKYLASGK